jgi:hypothetical protein
MSDDAPAPESSPAESAATELNSLQGDSDFLDAFNGVHGRSTQIEAASRKSALAKLAYGPAEEEAAPVLPEKVQEGLDSQSEINQAAAESMTPAVSVEEYKFQFQGAQDMSVEQVAEATSLAAETAMSIGASPSYAKATIEFVDAQLARPDMIPMGTDGTDLVAALNQKFGDADAVLADAKEAIDAMPEHSRVWVVETIEKLDGSTGAWLIGRLATVTKSKRPIPSTHV